MREDQDLMVLEEGVSCDVEMACKCTTGPIKVN